MTKICTCSLTVYFLLGKSGIKATFMHTKQMFMISSLVNITQLAKDGFMEGRAFKNVTFI